MADILTQIQDELDMLLNQMQSQLSYIKTRAPPAIIPGQPQLSTFLEQEAQTAAAASAHSQTQAPPPPPTQEEYQHDIRELSKDLVLKEQQIEVLIASLPGLHTSEKEQVERMKELEKELEDLEGDRIAAVEEKRGLVKIVEERIGSVRTVR
ncbi:hypothetical protein P280DRAFT_470343 [Massarina eburnea CBS 473.64]|uniref:Mediator of RNA polymerase II transcription subunit 21 n=1 Tax=Massarina eburnea CBS 473.64 TaxID=1395130 RepID=A0A6A6RW15_9PLEO|nr:hypothetical protein P280DRAFT_470343 [Massarina eburnea CBS 473.64]